MMKQISGDKVRDIVALLMKGKSTRVVAKSLGFSQSTVNRVRKKHCSHLELPKRGVPKILGTSERRRAVRLVTVGGVSAVHAAKVLREGREVGFCDNTLRSALRDAGLSASCKGYKRASSLQLGVEVINMVKAVKVYECGGVEKLKYEDVEVGSPQPGYVKIKHTAIGLNFIDTYFRRGQYKTEFPFIPGVEGAGTVEEVGPGVTQVNVGDRVCYAGPMGAYAEERLIVADKLLKIPDGVDDISAAAVALKGSTAQVLLYKTFKVEKGQFILIHAAAGGVGSLMVQWATHIGAKVIACVSTKEKAEQAKADGAQHIVLYSDKNLVERVKEITNGAGVSVVYDSVGKDTFQESLECLAIRGSFVSFGQSSGPPDPVPTSALASKSLFLSRPSLFHYTMTREDLEEISGAVLANVASGVLKIRVNHTYPLSQVAQAHADIEARKTSGSIILIPDGVKKV